MKLDAEHIPSTDPTFEILCTTTMATGVTTLPLLCCFLVVAIAPWCCGSSTQTSSSTVVPSQLLPTVPQVKLTQFWDLIANESRTAVLGVHIPGDGTTSAGKVLGRVAAAHAKAR